MLDLETLAENRARSLQQEAQEWRAAVWSEDFQKISQSMSDGEVEALIGFCPSVFHLKTIVKYLNVLFIQSGISPYTILEQEAAEAGMRPVDWIQSMVTDGQKA